MPKMQVSEPIQEKQAEKNFAEKLNRD